ncbi:MAG: 4Fe-4S binding protein [Candidatus Melainabacteria bacterium]
MFFFLGPLLNLFRLDMIHLKLIWLGKTLPMTFGTMLWLPVSFYLGVVAIGIVSFLWGRLFCGWACPHNTLTEWTRVFRAAWGREPYPTWALRLFQKQPALKSAWPWLSILLAILITATLSLLLAHTIVPLDWMTAQYASGRPHVALVFGNVLFTLIGLFLLFAGHDFCRTCCPYGMAQSMSAYQEGKWRPMEILFTGSNMAADCRTCTACQQVCPVDLDPRHAENLKVGEFFGCFNCGECIDACKQVHVFKKQSGLLKFELPWERRRRLKTPGAPGEPTPVLTQTK